MVAQFTQPQQLAPPPTASPSLSPTQWAQLAQLIQSQPQQGLSQPQAAPPSTSAYTSSGTMSGIDPALLQAQWLQYQNSQLAQSAIIPQVPQYQQQYAPQQPQYLPQGEFVTESQLQSIADFMQSSNDAAKAAAEYIGLLEWMAVEHQKLIQFSAAQDDLIWRFLHDREFTLDYIRGSWGNEVVTDEFMRRFADTYLEIAALSPFGIREQHLKNPEFTGNPNTRFEAIVPQITTPSPQSQIPPLPSSSGSASPYITLDQYLVAQQQGQVAQARAAALQNPAGLYGALFT